MQKYPEEVRQKARSLIENGMPKLEASRKLGISYRTVVDWTFDIKMRKNYPKHLMTQARKLVKRGLQKNEVPRIIGVPYATVANWTRGIETESHGNSRIAGTTLKILKELVAKGYVFDDKNPMNRSSYMTLKKYFPVKTTKSHGIRIVYMNGSARKALEALLKKLDLRSISYQELGLMRQAFGIKNMKRNNKIRERVFK